MATNAFTKLLGRDPSKPHSKSITAQLDDKKAILAAIPSGADATKYPTFLVDNKPYLFDAWLGDSSRKGRTSWITSHYFLLTKVDDQSRHAIDGAKWLCKACDFKGKVQWYQGEATTSAGKPQRSKQFISLANPCV